LWGGRFERAPNERFDAFQRSFPFDRRLLPYEIAVDRAWAKALEPIGIFTAAEVEANARGASIRFPSGPGRMLRGWKKFRRRRRRTSTTSSKKALVEETRAASAGNFIPAAAATSLWPPDFRLFVIDAAAEVQRSLEALLNAFLLQAKANIGVPMAGMTHMQHAQPILLSHFLLAHARSVFNAAIPRA